MTGSKITKINTFDMDGVITIGLTPRPEDIIITGRSYEEAKETYAYLQNRNIHNAVYFNPIPYEAKTRESSGQHKAKIIKLLQSNGIEVLKHFEDDEVQKAEIEKNCEVIVVHVVHNLTEKENVRHLEV